MKKMFWVLFTIFFMILIIFIITGILNKGQDVDVILIGVSLPLTGDAAVWGKSQKNGYELALDEINNLNGINGRQIKLLYGDDKGMPKEGVSILRKFIEIDKIDALTGVANSSVALAYIPIINKEKLIFISSGASSPKLTGSSKYFFRTWPSDIAEAIAMAKYAKNILGIDSISCLYINNDYGIGLAEPFMDEFKSLGGKILGKELFEQNSTDMRTQLTKIKNQNPEAIYLAGNPREMARCIKQSRELGLRTQFLSISTLNDSEVFNLVRSEDIEGTIITDASFDENSNRKKAEQFIKSFYKKFNKSPGILANTAYDALMILVEAISKVGLDSDKIAEYLHNMDAFEGVAGSMNFTQGGDINRPIRISIARNGQFIVIKKDFKY
ncbi:MAG: ABC transporter substrate-binding protein [Candidatus Lokiarchaeota archaeon]|nr:ABC transporter substrate-binding protein [Candidatus Lokiarchaeota archaeon]